MSATIQRAGRLSAWEAAGLLLLFLTVGVWGAAVTAVAIVAAAPLGGALGSMLEGVGPDRIMRRCLMGWAALFIAAMLWRGGWRGRLDCGFVSDDPGAPARPWWRQVLLGIGLGLVTLGGLSLLTLFLDQRVITPVATAAEGLRRALSFLGSGIAVALIEETVCRGMLFRVLARSWHAWPAAVATSMIFALAHFLSPDPHLSFQGGPFLATTFRVLVSTYVPLAATPSGGLVFFNLFLLGMVLCGFVVRTRTIWLAIGAHAAWVWVIKFFHLWTEVDRAAQPSPWLGVRSDFMDALAVTLLMAVLIAWGFGRRRQAGIVIFHRGAPWRVAPEDRDILLTWLAQHVAGDAVSGAKGRGLPGNGFKEGVVLKDHHGSRVMALGGRVVKSYGPKEGWTRFRFAFRASRTRRAFLLARDLLALGIATPRPLAWTVRRRVGLLRGESLVVEEAAGCERLTDSLAKHERDAATRARIMAAYGRLTALFHRNGYSNRDMKHDNIMGAIRAPWQIQVIDLDGVRRLRWISRRRAGRDLMRIGQSLASRGWAEESDRRAFFEAYNAELPPRLQRQAFPPETR